MMSRFRWTNSSLRRWAMLFERSGLEVVDADHAVALGEQRVTEMGAEEAGSAGDE